MPRGRPARVLHELVREHNSWISLLVFRGPAGYCYERAPIQLAHGVIR